MIISRGACWADARDSWVTMCAKICNAEYFSSSSQAPPDNTPAIQLQENRHAEGADLQQSVTHPQTGHLSNMLGAMRALQNHDRCGLRTFWKIC